MGLWFRAKCVATNKLVTVASRDVFEIREVTANKLWARKVVSISTVEEFNERAAEEKSNDHKTEYGIVKDNWMYRYRLLRVAETKEGIENDDTRVAASKRLSTSDVKIPLKYFLTYEEQEKTEKSEPKKKKNVKPSSVKGGKSSGLKILQRYDASRGNKKPKLKKVSTENSTTIVEDVSTEPLTSEVTDEVTENILINAPNENEIPPTVVTESESAENGSDCPDNELDRKETADDAENVEFLKNKIKELQKQLQQKPVDQQTKLLHKIAAQTHQISEKVKSSSSSSFHCNLKDIKIAFPPEGDITVPDGQIYVGGDKQFIDTEQVAIIDEGQYTLALRGEALFKLLAGDCISNYAKTMKGVKANRKLGLELKVMPENVVKSMTVLLGSGFQWLEGQKPTRSEISDFFRKQPFEVRRRLNNQELQKTSNKKAVKRRKTGKKKSKSEEDNSGSDSEGSAKKGKNDLDSE